MRNALQATGRHACHKIIGGANVTSAHILRPRGPANQIFAGLCNACPLTDPISTLRDNII